jgi:hypothetical protein
MAITETSASRSPKTIDGDLGSEDPSHASKQHANAELRIDTLLL